MSASVEPSESTAVGTVQEVLEEVAITFNFYEDEWANEMFYIFCLLDSSVRTRITVISQEHRGVIIRRHWTRRL